MTKYLISLMICLFFSACTTQNQYGECKGLANKEERRADLTYEVKKLNVFWAVLFSETLAVPVLTAAFWVWCPVGKK